MHKNLNKYSLKYQIISFKWAFNGLKVFFAQEVKPKIHAVAAVAAIALGIVLKVGTSEWIWISLSIALVFFAEIINTCIEEIVNTIHDDHDALRGKVKDMAAGAVLWASLFAVVVACFVFIPNLMELWKTIK